ncbi:MAG: hypothetical protein IPI67_05035 [Myxococcales bacterium]|nr:hypothetical protein [Myxococcales bacterium]
MRRARFIKLGLAALTSALGCQSIVGIEERHYEPPEQASPECKAYCDAVMKGCTGANAAYADRDSCIATCGKIPGGEANADNSLECRTQQAELAVSTGEPEVHCPAAGPFGAGTCGSTCQAYCTLLAASCADKLVGVSDCVSACSGLRADKNYDLTSLDTGDNLECRVAYAVKAAADPTTNCGPAALKSSGCVDAPDAAPSCEDVCNLVGAACTGSAKVYSNKAECLGVCSALDIGKNSDVMENTSACRKYHAYNSMAAPAQHCPHAGPGGDGHCGTDNCQAYCQLFSRVCKTEFTTSFGDESKCLTECAKLPGAAADTWSAASAQGNSVKCRLVNVARATTDATNCAAAAGGGECQ